MSCWTQSSGTVKKKPMMYCLQTDAPLSAADGGDAEGPTEMGTQASTATVEECGAKGRCDPAGVLAQFGEPDGSQPHGAGRSGALGHGMV